MEETGQKTPPGDMPHWNAFIKEVLASKNKPPQAERRGRASEQTERTKTNLSAEIIRN